MSGILAVVGEGQLAEIVREALSGQFEVIRQADFNAGVPDKTSFVLVLSDHWRPSDYQKAEELLQRTGIPWLSGFISFNEGVVGPLVRPGKPGCSQCADTRRLMAGRDREEMLELQMKLLMDGEILHAVPVSRMGFLQVGGLIAAEAMKAMQGKQALTEGRVYLVNLDTLETSLHGFLPDPLCSICSRLPDDSSAITRISLKPNPKPSEGIYRSIPLNELKAVMARDYLDTRTGLFNDKMDDLVSPFAVVCVNLPSSLDNEVTAGRTHSYAESELTAMLEGLERHCGMSPRGKRTVIRDAYRNLSERALDPVTVGVYSKEQYEQPDFPFEPFDASRPIDWVWGYSMQQERSILLPEQLAYYSLGFGGSYVHETSNGCALGGSLEEAVFYGILEVVERDSFLMTWYAKLPVPRLDPHSSDDKELLLMIGRLEAAGFDVLLFNTTMENGIPSVLAIAKNRGHKGANIICAAGAHVDPVRAAKSAIFELSGMMRMLEERLEGSHEAYVQMVHDSSLVRRMEDHALLYSVRQAEGRLQFLLDDHRPLLTFEEAFKQRPQHTDLTDDLKDLLQQFRRLNLDVIVVDQTTPEIQRNGLYCVKVLIPGMLPMTFGHHLIRLSGLDRVLNVPMRLGYAKQPLTFEQLNPYPHPFP